MKKFIYKFKNYLIDNQTLSNYFFVLDLKNRLIQIFKFARVFDSKRPKGNKVINTARWVSAFKVRSPLFLVDIFLNRNFLRTYNDPILLDLRDFLMQNPDVLGPDVKAQIQNNLTIGLGQDLIGRLQKQAKSSTTGKKPKGPEL